jgi:hypothetical protein
MNPNTDSCEQNDAGVKRIVVLAILSFMGAMGFTTPTRADITYTFTGQPNIFPISDPNGTVYITSVGSGALDVSSNVLQQGFISTDDIVGLFFSWSATQTIDGVTSSIGSGGFGIDPEVDGGTATINGQGFPESFVGILSLDTLGDADPAEISLDSSGDFTWIAPQPYFAAGSGTFTISGVSVPEPSSIILAGIAVACATLVAGMRISVKTTPGFSRHAVRMAAADRMKMGLHGG